MGDGGVEPTTAAGAIGLRLPFWLLAAPRSALFRKDWKERGKAVALQTSREGKKKQSPEWRGRKKKSSK